MVSARESLACTAESMSASQSMSEVSVLLVLLDDDVLSDDVVLVELVVVVDEL
jgi:hypothetical protein